VKPEAPLEVRGCAFLLRVCADQCGIQIDHHRTRDRDRRAVAPHLRPRRGTSPADRRDHRRRAIAQGVDQPADRGVGGHRAEQLRLGTHHSGIRQTVTAQRDCDRQIQHRLARIVHRPPEPPRTQRARQLASQAADCGGVHHAPKQPRSHERSKLVHLGGAGVAGPGTPRPFPRTQQPQNPVPGEGLTDPQRHGRMLAGTDHSAGWFGTTQADARPPVCWGNHRQLVDGDSETKFRDSRTSSITRQRKIVGGHHGFGSSFVCTLYSRNSTVRPRVLA
jgi:hypothetical protein